MNVGSAMQYLRQIADCKAWNGGRHGEKAAPGGIFVSCLILTEAVA